MNYNKIYFLVFLFSLPNALLSQSFEKKINLDLLNNILLQAQRGNPNIKPTKLSLLMKLIPLISVK